MMILTPEELEVLLLSSKVAATCLIVSLIPAILIESFRTSFIDNFVIGMLTDE